MAVSEQLDARMSASDHLPIDGSQLGSAKKISPITLTAALVLVPILSILLKKFLFPTFDPREPPVLRPRIPFVGHIIGMIRERTSCNESSMPICTLPMLHGKMYVINSPDLISAAMKNTHISFNAFLKEVPVGLLGLDQRLADIASDQRVIDSLIHVIHSTLTGEPLYRMNVQVLSAIMGKFNGIPLGTGAEVDDTYEWIWDIMFPAGMHALFGEKNPFTSEHKHLIRQVIKQKFEDGAAILTVNIAPKLLAAEALRARNELNVILEPYYAAGYEKNPDVSGLIQERTKILREEGFDDHDLGIQEITMPWVAVTNTIPTLFWFFVHIFSQRHIVEKIRGEIEAVTTITDTEEGRAATISAKELDKQCEYLYACYREMLRLVIHNTGSRRVENDTTIKDSQGREYLLTKGTNIQWPSSLTHQLDSVWGDDAQCFKPERFLDVSAQEEKRRRGANIPFGGGKYLCPGRQFAVAESLGFVGVLAAGFEVEGVVVPDSEDPAIGVGTRKPIWGSTSRGAKITRRVGWEDVLRMAAIYRSATDVLAMPGDANGDDVNTLLRLIPDVKKLLKFGVNYDPLRFQDTPGGRTLRDRTLRRIIRQVRQMRDKKAR
ncbi:hypothetical protein NM208_g3026 [Fusarium decemcellulare]|uniref:Uncharacterized protein n=1 Tax=Fusarium decemcellulare TaxID=57161 RepID=A0ACC1SQD7_9HYPO|nr:hypothetical protein NM208_g3026 [Fusarium decemcellulare]